MRDKDYITVPYKATESLRLAVLLALVGGFLDAYTYVQYDHVFANAQTGNIVLLGLRAAALDVAGVLRYLLPIAAFVAGALLTAMIRRHFPRETGFHWRQVVLLIEVAMLALVGVFPTLLPPVAVTTIISFICAVQACSFRKLYGAVYATTMCTGNLRSASEQFYQFLVEKDRMALVNCLRYLLVIGTFILGAMIGGVCSHTYGAPAVLLCCFLLLVGVLLMFQKTVRRRSPKER